ncbi:MAG TPA: ATP-binding cassette domain-containing protein [Actinomycetota bacterium]|nr:ATP-binding cassette domain-containing protein [Actinomycetota bacterium]
MKVGRGQREEERDPPALASLGAGTGTSLRRSVRIRAENLTRRVRTGATVLHDVSLSIEPGEVVGIVGGSGTGKTTLLEALAGVQAAEAGAVWFDGVEISGSIEAWRQVLGYVPQDDIIHADLPLARTLRYAAGLRLPSGTSPQEIEQAVTEALRALDLQERADVPVGSLSGGQRKRASIAVELLTHPRAFFLDEPTSGLDPATGAELLRVLRRLAAAGATIVFTTHAPQDISACDRIVFLAKGGHLAFLGTPAEAIAYFDVPSVERIYERLAAEESPEAWAARFRDRRAVAAGANSPASAEPAAPLGPRPGPAAQWWVLTRRTFETLVRNRLTLAILVGSPVMVVAMFTILFRPGAFDPRRPEPSAILMILFWITFAAFFFGLTYGLLQIVTERAILRREHLGGVGLGPYLLSKVAVLLPFLLAVNVLMLLVLRALDRLPADSLRTYLSVGGTLALLATAALALGLLTSAGVANPSQATLALPLLSFPAVLFSGAILPVHIMAGVGKAISLVIPVRWAFEAVGRALGVRELLMEGGSPLGPPLVASYGAAGLQPIGVYWAILAGFIVAFLVGARLLLQRTATAKTR